MFWLRNKTINYLVLNHNWSSGMCHSRVLFTYMFVQNKFLISFYNKLFLSILTASPPWPIMPLLYDVWNKKNYNCLQKDEFGHGGGGGGYFTKTFCIYNMLIGKNRVFIHIFNWYLSNEKKTFADNLRVEPTIFFMKNFVLAETILWPFLGNLSLRLSEVLIYNCTMIFYPNLCIIFIHNHL